MAGREDDDLSRPAYPGGEGMPEDAPGLDTSAAGKPWEGLGGDRPLDTLPEKKDPAGEPSPPEDTPDPAGPSPTDETTRRRPQRPSPDHEWIDGKWVFYPGVVQVPPPQPDDGLGSHRSAAA